MNHVTIIYLYLLLAMTSCYFKLYHLAIIRLKKKILCLKACENFSTRRGMQFFIFYFILFIFFTSIGLCLHAHPKPKITEKFQLPFFSEIKRDFARFLSSHVLKFFQNSKLSSFFVVKMKKNNNFKKKKMKVWILQNQMRTEKQMRAAALRQIFFFFLAL